MANILVVDDSAIDRTRAGRLLEKEQGVRVTYAVDGRAALDEIQARIPDLIVTDLQMPEMNGLELVEAIKREYPSIPVVLMTARGSEDIAAEALRKGAASYVPKSRLGDQLRETVHRILQAAGHDRMQSRLMHSLETCHLRFRLRNDEQMFEPLVAQLQGMLRCLPLGDEAERLRVCVAVKHALLIAMHHGNLDIPLDESLDDAAVAALIAQRMGLAECQHRMLTVDAKISPDSATVTIRHEGTPINPAMLPANLEAAAADHGWLGGFVFLPSVMDEVHYADGGREIVLVKRAANVALEDLEVTAAME
ncbi:MAG: response regulator [Planctomyces sp.]|nr:response regulator [Planctomyces sp.]